MAHSAATTGFVHTGRLAESKAAQVRWQAQPIGTRLRVLTKLRAIVAEHAKELAALVDRPVEETLVSEVLPLLEASRFLERRAGDILAPRRERRHRPVWLFGVSLEIVREPFGTVLVIGPSNYPLLLPAVHALQAITAGNAVVLKPGTGALPVLRMFVQMFMRAGLPNELCLLLGEDPAEVGPWIAAGVDKVVLTGSSRTGKAVLESLSGRLIPSVMELSGEDACIVLEDANPELAAQAIRFGLSFNAGNTCIAPQRFFVHKALVSSLESRLPSQVRLTAFATEQDVVERANNCEYGLGTSVFGGKAAARKVARQLRCGVVVINDMIVPTADPRLPFGGRGRSGFGVTRGAEGLLEMTTVKAISSRKGSLRPHFLPSKPSDVDLFSEFIGAAHGGSFRARAWHAYRLIRAAAARSS